MRVSILARFVLLLASFCAASTPANIPCDWMTLRKASRMRSPVHLRDYLENCIIQDSFGAVFVLDNLREWEVKSLMLLYCKRLLSTTLNNFDGVLLHPLTWNSVFKWPNFDWIEELLQDDALRHESRFDFLKFACERGRTDVIYLIFEDLSTADWRSEEVFALFQMKINSKNYDFAIFLLQNAISNGARLTTTLNYNRDLQSSQREYLNSLLQHNKAS